MIGKTLGHYRVGEQLGRGGMGEVYLADDLNLNRKVALKFLPDAFTGDPERMARFEREAKLLASLNHPNIAAIYGLEEAEGKRFLVLELVEGDTLAQRLSKGALSVEEALGVCRQIADGLEAAHEKGVIHRDLKPANVMITAGDKVKILDFGLAKALSDETQSVDSSQSPTLTEAMTRPGVILGTAAYMSPEQAKGKVVDKRADIWAFGCILYECLTGKRAFEGETVTETLASVLKNEPDWQALPPATPPNIRFLLRRCLEKNINRRFHWVGDLRIEIEESREIGEAMASVKRPWLAWCVAGVLLLALLFLSFLYFRQKAPAFVDAMRFQIGFPDKVNPEVSGGFAVSPDGRRLAFTGVGSDGIPRLWLRALDSLEARPLSGTEINSNTEPFSFWSPDSRFIAFDAGRKLMKIDVSGGPPQTIADLSGNAVGGSWNREGVIVFADYNASNGIMQVSAAGGAATPVTKLSVARKDVCHLCPTFLPDGRRFLYFCSSAIPGNTGMYVGSLDTKPEEQSPQQLMMSSWVAAYVPPGQLLFLRDRALMAQTFDDKRLRMIGEPVPLANQVGYYINYGFFSASTNGILIFRGSGSQFSQPTWFDRQGKILGREAEKGTFSGIALSPDGTRAAVGWTSSLEPSLLRPDILLLDFARNNSMRFTFGQGSSLNPIWSPDGSRIIFAADLDGSGVNNLYQKPASGVKNEELLLKSGDDKYPTSWSSDGRFLLYTASDPKTKGDLWVLPMESNGKGMPFLRTEFNECYGHFSPDSRYVAYQSDESGRNEIYVREFWQGSAGPSLEKDGKWVISRGGGTEPHWRSDGRELYYRASDGKVMAVEVKTNKVFQAGTPKPLFQPPADVSTMATWDNYNKWDVTADGNRFFLPTSVEESVPTPFTVFLNWTSLLKK